MTKRVDTEFAINLDNVVRIYAHTQEQDDHLSKMMVETVTGDHIEIDVMALYDGNDSQEIRQAWVHDFLVSVENAHKAGDILFRID